MKAYTKRLSGTLVILMLVIAFAIPATAMAAENAAENMRTKLPKASVGGPMGPSDDPAGPSDGSAGAGTPLSAQTKAIVRTRTQTQLQTRTQLLDCVNEVLTSRIMRLDEITARLAAAGCDVGEARALLGEARGLMGDASGLEAQAVGAFQSIADADNPYAAFTEARDRAFQASRTRARAYANVCEAARLLNLCVEGLVTE